VFKKQKREIRAKSPFEERSNLKNNSKNEEINNKFSFRRF